jgi:hypothetical protein
VKVDWVLGKMSVRKFGSRGNSVEVTYREGEAECVLRLKGGVVLD